MNRKNFLKITALGLPFIPKVFAQERKNMNDDVLILYYSWSGNTRHIANAIQKYSAATLRLKKKSLILAITIQLFK
jgi:hypothetical protein